MTMDWGAPSYTSDIYDGCSEAETTFEEDGPAKDGWMWITLVESEEDMEHVRENSDGYDNDDRPTTNFPQNRKGTTDRPTTNFLIDEVRSHDLMTNAGKEKGITVDEVTIIREAFLPSLGSMNPRHTDGRQGYQLEKLEAGVWGAPITSKYNDNSTPVWGERLVSSFTPDHAVAPTTTRATMPPTGRFLAMNTQDGEL